MNKIKLFDPVIGINEKRAIIIVLESKFWASGSGSGNVLKFEEKFRKYKENIKGSLVRIYCGNEDSEDLINDITEALKVFS